MFKHNPDGTIEVMINTVDGVKQVSYLNPFVRVEAETFNSQKGIKTQVCSNGGMNVCIIKNGDWIKVKGVDFGKSSFKNFSASIAGNNGQIEIILDDPSEKPIGVCQVTSTEGAQQWKTISCKVNKVQGIHDLFFVFKGGKGNLFNFDWWKFYRNN